MNHNQPTESQNERLLSAEEVGQLLGVSARMVLALPIRRIQVGPRTIRYLMSDVFRHLGIENPTSSTTEAS